MALINRVVCCLLFFLSSLAVNHAYAGLGLGRILIVIGHDGFWYSEYAIPKKLFEEAGFEVVVASSARGEARPLPKTGGGPVLPDFVLTDAKMDDYQAIIFVGGSEHAMNEYIQDPVMAMKTKELMQAALKERKVVGGLCHGTGILAAAGILEGKRANGFASIRPMLTKFGATVVKQKVVVDGLIVTGRDHEVASEFAEAIQELLQKRGLPD